VARRVSSRGKGAVQCTQERMERGAPLRWSATCSRPASAEVVTERMEPNIRAFSFSRKGWAGVFATSGRSSSAVAMATRRQSSLKSKGGDPLGEEEAARVRASASPASNEATTSVELGAVGLSSTVCPSSTAPRTKCIEHNHSPRWEIAVLLITVDEGRHHRGCTKKVHDDD
jgi:hypothetical protein